MARTLLLAAFLFVPFPATARAQAAWTHLYPSSSPSARFNFSTAFDSARSQMLIFGGRVGSSGTNTNETWRWDGTTWAQMPTPAGLTARYATAMAFDEARGRIILFGGNSGFNLQETWEWNGSAWNQRTPATSPSARSSAAMAYDPLRQRIVLFGGGGNTGFLGDLWEWDGQTWTQRTFNVGPAARGSAMAFDPNLGEVLLFGGSGDIQVFDDTWSWNGQVWTQRLPALTPYLRSEYVMCTDVARRRVLLLGSNLTPDPFVWEWDGSDWACQFVGSPTTRFETGLAYDPGRGEAVLFGGIMTGPGPVLADTWVYRTPHPASFLSFGQGCTGSTAPTLRAVPYSLPWLGDTFRSQVTAVPGGSAGAVFVTGLASTSAQSLAPFGLPGCSSFVTLDSSRFIVASGGIAEWSIQVPLDAGLTGMQLFQQALVLDSLAIGGATVTNAATATVGVR